MEIENKKFLKPCPFCGGKAYFLHGRKNECITCEECGHRFYSLEIGEDAQKELWKQWNSRPIEDALQKENIQLREALEKIKDRAEIEESYASNATYGFAYEIEELAREALKGGEEC